MEKDRLSILEKIEQGELSVEEAEKYLGQELDEEEIQSVKEDISEIQVVEEEKEEEEVPEPIRKEEKKEEEIEPEKTIEFSNVPTRRERKLILAERLQEWAPEMMVGMVEGESQGWQWPWEDESWQWMWQNFEHPIYISHSIDVSEGNNLDIVSYQGDLFVRGWDKPNLKIDGAVFDLRIGQDDNTIRVASSTGQMQIWVPEGISRMKARVEPGDMWLSKVSADMDIYCQSGDLGCEQIKGELNIRVNGGDTRLIGIDGSIDISANKGNCDIRDINSDNINISSKEGDIWLNLASVSNGNFICMNEIGDINVLLDGDLSGELIAEATNGGQIAPVALPWQKLLGRSENKLHGILKEGGASINLSTRGGRIYIQETWKRSISSPSMG
ncbi:hypothetical protein GF312_07560 [Candidatus Poribacteria bacterium]|nr:hypothetical protein [Candidatus Poribacteria bacterium]